ncbi:hypothetical protein [Azospirillum sp.]|nr:hypothetical protein [Azospirillum sp.]HYD69072.1 hypothetical protein [Azospirillum sp.]
MADQKTPPTRNATQARQGSMEHVGRYVLGIGLPLAIIAMIVAFVFVF